MKYITILLLLLLAITATAEDRVEPIRPVNTFSIICFDSATGEFGGAVQSHWFKVADVIWIEPGVGAVVTQSFVDFAYGPVGLEMMKNGRSAKQALDGMLASDNNNLVRQAAMIDKNGVVVTHTGENCIAEAGHLNGTTSDGIVYSVQANLMEKNTVWEAMKNAFETTKGDLAERMMTALEAAQAEKGDIRGKQSAAMFVAKGIPTGMDWLDFKIDLRVDDHKEPLVELRRLLNVALAYDHISKGDEFIALEEFDKAKMEYSRANELAPDNLEILYWYAITLATVDQLDQALPIFKKIFAKDQNWKTLTPRLVDSKILPDNKEMLDQIMAQ